jgi:hypothetical protein
MLNVLAALALVLPTGHASAQQEKVDPLPSWNAGPAKNAILEFVRVTTEKDGAKYVPPEQRIATFDRHTS